MSIRKRILALLVTGVMAASAGGGTALYQADVASAHAGHSRVAANAYIKAHGGIPACKHEDAVLKVNGKKVTCVWWAGARGNGKGDSFLHLANGKYVYITGPDARQIRY
jgi:hypothetical protein